MNAQPKPAALPVEQWRLPDHLDLPPGPIDTTRPPWVWPDHTMLPCEDGVAANDAQEGPLTTLLTECLRPELNHSHPAGDYFIGQKVGIYWDLTNPLRQGCTAPDWYLVCGVPSRFQGELRRSYVLWREEVYPLIVLEHAPGGALQERDRTPRTGKFWLYENRIRVTYYGIFDPAAPASLEFHHMVDGTLQLAAPNSRGHFEVPQLGVELGIWEGTYQGIPGTWLRWWDGQGRLLPTDGEVAEQEKQRAEQADQRAEHEKHRAAQADQRAADEADKARRLADKLRALGINPDDL